LNLASAVGGASHEEVKMTEYSAFAALGEPRANPAAKRALRVSHQRPFRAETAPPLRLPNLAAEPPTPPDATVLWTLAGVIGTSPAIRKACELACRIAPSDASVLLTGESGTGKELFARAIHRESGRRGRFVALNCAAMTEQLLESELFGHVRGAFTDAKSSRAGLFIEADDGTLFLDEIAEMPAAMQTKLLRAVEERKVRPVGSSHEIPFDARIVAATNKDVELELEQGRFRQDLFYRINVVRIAVPPLRARGTDVLLLAREFLGEAAKRNGKTIAGMSDEFVEKLLQYPFPGNVRELMNAIERSVALTHHDRLTVEDLPPSIRSHTGELDAVSPGEPQELLPLRDVERLHIRRVMRATGGNKTRAARLLGVDRRTLYRKLAR
jgi:two-component system response regulator AtoC